MHIQTIEVDEDHVHLYIEIPPQRSVGEAVRILKSVSARMMFKRYGYFKKKIWSGKLWGASYFVRTVGEGVTAGMVRRYIEEHAEKGMEPVKLRGLPRRGSPMATRIESVRDAFFSKAKRDLENSSIPESLRTDIDKRI